MVISLISTTFRHVSMIYLTFRVLFVKLCSLMLCLDSSVPEDVPRCSASTLALLASFINSDNTWMKFYLIYSHTQAHGWLLFSIKVMYLFNRRQ